MKNVELTKLTLAATFAISLAACGGMEEPSDDSGLEGAIATASQSLGTCSPSITGAAITKQIVSIEEPTAVLVELTTITPKPYSASVSGFTFPAGFMQGSLGTTICVDLGAAYKCRHQGNIIQTNAMNGNGAYSMTLNLVADANSGCSNGSQRVDFSLTTENFGYYDVDGFGQAGVALYGKANYEEGGVLGWAVRFDDEGFYTFTERLSGMNDALSSVRVDRGWKVTLFENANMTGRSKVVTADMPFVGWDFNDVTSAIQVSRM